MSLSVYNDSAMFVLLYIYINIGSVIW